MVYDEDVKLGGRLTELLLQDLKYRLHDPGGVPQCHSNVTQSPDGVVWDQVSVPKQEGGTCVNTLSNSDPSQSDPMTHSLVIFLIDVETIGQTSKKSFHNHIIHSQPGFQAPVDQETKMESEGFADASVYVIKVYV